MKRISVAAHITLFVLGPLWLCACDSVENREIKGSTMGTYFIVETNCENAPQENQLVAELDRLISLFSTYSENSQINQINADESEEWISVHEDFVYVAEKANEIYVLSAGAFDPSVSSLVELWGFGTRSRSTPPTEVEIESALKQTGYELVEIQQNPPAIRKPAQVDLDFSAIAKGFAVDRVALLIEQSACSNYMVDIGGEVRVLGTSASQRAWRIGIANPVEHERAIGYLELSSGAVASSGTTLNFYEANGKMFSHLVNPTTGRPVTHAFIGVSVYASTALEADALATALLVMGPIQAEALIDDLDLAALLIKQVERNSIEVTMTERFERVYKSY